VHSITDDPIASYDGDFTKYMSLLCVSVNMLHILYILKKFPTVKYGYLGCIHISVYSFRVYGQTVNGSVYKCNKSNA
jgi:hypothetical protein